MWIVRLALRRPYTFVVAAMLAIILGVVAVLRMPTDIFPEINIPVISVAFSYTGMSADDMSNRIITPFERILTTTVNQIEHIESQSLTGVGVTKIYFQPGAGIEEATAQVTAVAQTATRIMPPGTQPPLIIQYNASNVPVIELSISSDTIPEQQLFDLTVNQLRPRLVVIPGVQVPYPYGGKQRQVLVDLDPEKLYGYGISPADVSNAIAAQNLILPGGSAKVGVQELPVLLNSSPDAVAQLNDLPVKSIGNTTIYVKDVAHVRDGFIVQTNVVHANGKLGILQPILKSGGASTLDVVDSVKKALPQIQLALPPDLKITPMFDQSVFVRASVEGVIKEAAIAAGLTAMMILLFLGSWRSTVIVMVSIPLSIMVSIIILYFLGHSLNVMTLGGMALAVGILVDDATVEIENIHRNLHQRKRLVQAILDGASQIAVPAFVSTLCICIVFVPVVFISGSAKFLFTPLAMSVVFAMLTSYLLSRTLVPTMVHYLLAAEVEMYGGVIDKDDPHAMKMLEEHQHPHVHAKGHKSGRLIAMLAAALLVGYIAAAHVPDLGAAGAFAPEHAIEKWIAGNVRMLAGIVLLLAAAAALTWVAVEHKIGWRIHNAFNNGFEWLRLQYGGLLEAALEHRGLLIVGFVLIVVLSCGLFWMVGTDFFPSVDAGQIRLHVRTPPGTRIEETSRDFARVANEIRGVIPAKEITALLDNMGIPNSSINLSLSDGTLISPADGEILISLAEGHKPTPDYMRQLRKTLPEKFPGMTFWFAPADIVTQVLNFGLSAPIDVQIADQQLGNIPLEQSIAAQIRQEVAAIPGVVDVRIHQVPKTPDLLVNVDRTLASELGVTQQTVASDLLISLSSSNQTQPNFWLNPKNGVSYSIYIQTPQYWMGTINELDNTPMSTPNSNPLIAKQLLANVASTTPGVTPTNVTHYNIASSLDVLMNVQGSDLGSAATKIEQIVARHQYDPNDHDAAAGRLPRGATITLRGQIQSMHDSFTGLGLGLIFAVVLVYLLMVINFQSWIDPLIILMALPGALSGILWMLWATGTTISVPALMGAIMSIGVATANSILMITFANDQRAAGMNAHDAALLAGMTRLRPVMMTALAMIIGMLPMSLGLGEGGEQNAPLGRAVIGGLAMATVATLFFVPAVYSLLRVKAPITHVEPELME